MNWRPPKERDTSWGENSSLQWTPTGGLVTVRVTWGWSATGPNIGGIGINSLSSTPQTFDALAYGVLATGVQSRSDGGTPEDPPTVRGTFGQWHLTDPAGNIGYTWPAPIFSGSVGSPPGFGGSVSVTPYVNFAVLSTGRPLPPPFDLGGGDAGELVLPVPVPARVDPAEDMPPLVPVPVPRPAPAVPAPAERSPVTPPAPVPGGLPGGRPALPPAPSVPSSPSAAPPAAPVLPTPLPITAGGVRPQAPALPPATAPGTTFLPGGIQLAPNGPPATMQGMATELGKLEQKLEILLRPDGPPSLLDNINRVIDQIENIKFVLDALFPPEPYRFDAGGYELTPVCDRDAEGELLPARVAPWEGGEGEFAELRQRLDALARLIQLHKETKQPTCGGRTNGPAGDVTVRFESD